MMTEMNTNNPFFSVIIPVYNVGKYLEECLESLLNQTLENIEIICINDGSTDNSLSILYEYRKKDKRVIVVNKSNGGVSSARNIGLRIARGEYIVFVDADDIAEKRLCERVWEEEKNTGGGIVVFGANIFPLKTVDNERWLIDTLEVKETVYDVNCEKALFKEKCSKPFLWNKCYKRDLIIKNSIWFHEDISLGEDNLFQFMVFPKADKVVFIKDVLYNYRCMRENSAMDRMRRNSEWKIQMHMLIMENVFMSWLGYGILDKYANELYTWCYYFVVREIEISSLPVEKKYKLLKSVETSMKQYGFVLQEEFIDLLESKEKILMSDDTVLVEGRS